MKLGRLFNKIVNISRLTAITGTNKQTYQLVITGLNCRISQLAEEPMMMGDGATFIPFKMWCNEADIKEGDRVIDGKDVYAVRGIKKLDRSFIPGTPDIHHLEIMLSLTK